MDQKGSEQSFLSDVEIQIEVKTEALNGLISRMENMSDRFLPEDNMSDRFLPEDTKPEGPPTSGALVQKFPISQRIQNNFVTLGNRLNYAHGIMSKLEKIV